MRLKAYMLDTSRSWISSYRFSVQRKRLNEYYFDFSFYYCFFFIFVIVFPFRHSAETAEIQNLPKILTDCSKIL